MTDNTPAAAAPADTNDTVVIGAGAPARFVLPPSKKVVPKKGAPAFRLGTEVSQAIRRFFRNRGWRECPADQEEGWNIFWRDRTFPRPLHMSLTPAQRLNHLQNTAGVTRKDHLVRTMRRMRKLFGSIYDIVPRTFLMPREIDLLAAHIQHLRQGDAAAAATDDLMDESEDAAATGAAAATAAGAAAAGSAGAAPATASAAAAAAGSTTATAASSGGESKYHGSAKDAVWIYKPAGDRRGNGIYVFRDISELKLDGIGVVQRYVHNPYLIHGYKFDMRLYVLMTTAWPTICFLHKRGLARFSTQKYDMTSLENNYSHLTNSTINKKSPTMHVAKEIGYGCKWTLEKLFAFLRERGHNTQRLWRRIKRLVLLTVLPLAGQVPEDPLCWELFGFDVLLDADLNPVLLEVNRSPAMAVSSEEDLAVKTPMLTDMFNILELDERVLKTGPAIGAAAAAAAGPKAESKDSRTGGRKLYNTAQQRDTKRADLKRRAGEFELVFPFNNKTEAACLALRQQPLATATPQVAQDFIALAVREVKKQFKRQQAKDQLEDQQAAAESKAGGASAGAAAAAAAAAATGDDDADERDDAKAADDGEGDADAADAADESAPAATSGAAGLAAPVAQPKAAQSGPKTGGASSGGVAAAVLPPSARSAAAAAAAASPAAAAAAGSTSSPSVPKPVRSAAATSTPKGPASAARKTGRKA